MCVVQLIGCELWKFTPSYRLAFESSNDICKGAGNEEVLLLETELLAHVEGVVRIEHLTQVLCKYLCPHCLNVVSLVELLEVELIGRFCTPETERIDCLASVADYGHVVSNTLDLVCTDPFILIPATFSDYSHLSTKAYCV